MQRWKLVSLGGALACLAGCESFNGPGIDYTAPRVTGRVLDDSSGQPIRFARVGRKLWTWRKGGGEFLKGGEETLLLQECARTDAGGNFTLPSKQVALLFSFGEVPLNLKVTAQHGGFVPWQTNFPITSLATNSATLRLDAGEVRLRAR